MVAQPLCAMKTDAMARDEVEFFADIGQGNLGIDTRADAAHMQQSGRAVEKRLIKTIQAEPVVAQRLADVKKITGAAAQIENPQRRRAIEPEILRPFGINRDPVCGIIVAVNPRRFRARWIKCAQLSPGCRIKAIEERLGIYRMSPAAHVLPQALDRVEGKQFLKFSRKSHLENDAAKLATDKRASSYGEISARIRPVEPSCVIKPLAQPLPG